MKKILTIFNSSVFCLAIRLMIVSVSLVCTSTVMATSTKYIKVYVASNCRQYTGVGVYISKTELGQEPGYYCPGGEKCNSDGSDQSSDTGDKYLYATGGSYYYHTGWSDMDNSEPSYGTDRAPGYAYKVSTNAEKSYYAYFLPYLQGYRYPFNVKIMGVGKICIPGTVDWKESEIVESDLESNPIIYKKQDDTYEITVQAEEIENRGYKFVGWFDNNEVNVSSDKEFTSDITIDYCPPYGEGDPSTPIYTAKFITNYFYYNYATAAVDNSSIGMGQVYVDYCQDNCMSENVDEGNWKKDKCSVGSDSDKKNDDHYTYTYYAKPNDGYGFVGWHTENGDLVSRELCFTRTVWFGKKANEGDLSWEEGENSAKRPETLYAVFQTSRPYYHGRATVGVARNSEDGKVYVSNEQLNITDIPESNWFTPTYDDDDLSNDTYKSEEVSENLDGIDNYDPEIIELPENVYEYTYHYYATPENPEKSAFYGWTIMSNGSNVFLHDNPYEITYDDASGDINSVESPLTMYAVFRSYYHTLPRIICMGSGQVMIDVEGHNSEYVDGGINDITPIQTPAPVNKNYQDYNYTLKARAMTGSNFIGWSLTADGKNIISTNEEYVASGRSYSISADDPHRLTYYAIFDSDVKFKHVDRMIYYQDIENEYINDVKVIVEVTNTAKISVNLSGDYASEFSISNESLTNTSTPFYMDASQGIIPLRLSYIGGLSDAIGKEVKIEVSAYDNENIKLAANDKIVVIEELPVITFLPTDGKAKYTVSRTDGSGVSYVLDESSTQSVKIEIENESMSYVHLNLDVNTVQEGLKFFGWKVQDKENNVSYLPYIDPETNTYKTDIIHHFDEPVEVSPEFIPDDLAQFIIKAYPNVPYHNLHDAIEKAKVGGSGDEKIIVVAKDGRLAKDTYDIPNGVTLLVPGTSDNRSVVGDLTETDFLRLRDFTGDGDVEDTNDNPKIWDQTGAHKPGCWRKLFVEDGTKLNLLTGASLCVYAKMVTFGQDYLTFPYNYGHLELGNGALITVKEGANLACWGFITNPNKKEDELNDVVENNYGINVNDYNYKEVGRVIADPNSEVREAFAFRDFRGGTKMGNFVETGWLGGIVGGVTAKYETYGYLFEVFPFLQYYVQNIEVPITFRHGSNETVNLAVDPEGSFRVAAPTFIGAGGLFQWGHSQDAMVTKFYDASTDRLRIIIEDKKVKTNTEPSILLGSMLLVLEVLSQPFELASGEYVLPIQNNIDIVLKSAVCKIPKGINLSLMAESSLTIDENSRLINESELYVYDNEQAVFPEGEDCSGYSAPRNQCVLPFKNRPYSIAARNGTNTATARTSMRDATIVVDGIMDNTNGFLITTEGGANITSNGGGMIIINKFGTQYSGTEFKSSFKRNQSLYQFAHHDYKSLTAGFHAIALSKTNAGTYYPKLRNADNSFTDAITIGTYYYCDGEWGQDNSTGDCEHKDPHKDYTPRFTINDVDLTAYVGKGIKNVELDELVNPNNPNINDEGWSSVGWSATFTGDDANLFNFDSNNKVLSFTPASAGPKKAVMVLKAVYTYNSKKYVHREVVDLNALAIDLAENTLAFNDLTKLYAGQGETPLFTTMSENANPIALTIFDKKGDKVASELSDFGISGNTIAPALEIDEALIDTFTIRAVQAEDGDKQIKGADISTTLIINPLVVWNWSELYYPTENVNPITMMNGATDWTLRLKEETDYDLDKDGKIEDEEETEEYKEQIQGSSIVEFAQDEDGEYKAVINDPGMGVYTVYFEFTYKGQVTTFESTIYRDPRRLTVNVNEALTFRAVTIGAHKGISFDDETDKVTIQTEQNATNTWTLNFLGIPDKLGFTPTGDNPWQIEESPNGKSWATTFAWERLTNGQPFEFSLMPSTRYLRISYGANTTSNSIGTLTNVYITKLEGVKFNPSKLYMPATIGENKNVAVTYVSDVPVVITSDQGGPDDSKEDKFRADPNQLPLDEGGKPYAATDVLITNSRVEEPELANVHMTSSYATDQLPIQTYGPQALPIILASDMPAERFYYVTPYYHNVTWDNDTRTITMNNKIASAQPYMVFHFGGIAKYISFNHNTDIKGDWIFEWSTDGKDWKDPTLGYSKTVSNSTGDNEKEYYTIKQEFDYGSEEPSYIRVTYNSLSREKVDITNLMIISGSAAYTDPNKLTVWFNSETDNFKDFHLKTINITNPITVSVVENNIEKDEGENNEGESEGPHFTIKYGNNGPTTAFVLNATDNSNIIGSNVSGDLPITVYYDGARASAYATIVVQQEGEVLATVDVTGLRKGVTAGHEWYTGVAAGYDIQNKSDFEGRERTLLSLKNTFSSGENPLPLFDYLYLFGETTTTDGTKYITDANTRLGSNAKTPCYIYKKNVSKNCYDFVELVENANTSVKVTANRTKTENEETVSELALVEEGVSEELKVYISGFCPFTSTGYTKLDEGIFYFQGGKGDHVHVYLEHCFLYSRAKTIDGHHFEDRSDGNSFTENYARGSGAVLVFECQDEDNFKYDETIGYNDDEKLAGYKGYAGYVKSEELNAKSIAEGGDELYDSWLMWVKPGYNAASIPFKVTIHTRGNNLLKSHYGCFLESVAGRAFQASSPVQIHLKSAAYEQASFTELNFDDIWPTGTNTTERTNGKLKLQKRVNNAPSIDMGNDKTVVNFNGGQIELQNAQIVSHNYRSSLAICPRSGYFAQFKLAVGMGTDGVGGMVNFNDGTTTVKEMYVSPKYADCYLLDKNEQGTYIKETIKGEGCYRTSCIRAPRHTYVYGGSHGMMRACKNASSQGGAPTDGVSPLGKFEYTEAMGWESNTEETKNNVDVGLVTPTKFPDKCLKEYYNGKYTYGLKSVTPVNGKLNLWLPKLDCPEFKVDAEVDKDISFWKTCMTSIKAEYGGYGGEVGGKTSIKMFDPTRVEFNLDNQKEIVKHLLYCAIDENISKVIHGGDFSAYVKNPAYVGDTYVPIKPTYVGDSLLHNIINIQNYQVENKVYYIVPAVADVWNAFTAPFDVAKIYVMETYSEDHLDRLTWDRKYVESLGLETLQSRSDILKLQARQNAYFASFFAVTIALDQDKTFEVMYDEYMDWARLQDIQSGFWSDEMGDLTAYKNNGPRGMRELVPYTGSNWSTADFYLNKNTGSWTLKYDSEEDGEGDEGDDSYIGNFETSWTRVEGVNDKGVLLEQGETYSMLFPYCTGCIENSNTEPTLRSFYDYWTGKFLIFESREGVDGNRHEIHGSTFVKNKMTTSHAGKENTAMIMGNSSFEILMTPPEIFNYSADLQHSTFFSEMNGDDDYPVNPTGSFLVLNVPNQENVASVSMQGIVTYRGPQDTPTGGMTPTVGGGRDMFITGITGGINVAVASPQQVLVVSATGTVLYSGYVNDNVDVPLPLTGIYVVKGENEVQKIFY